MTWQESKDQTMVRNQLCARFQAVGRVTLKTICIGINERTLARNNTLAIHARSVLLGKMI
jgi:hypothetical protein